ncbi:hypothetical protein ES708_33322 [subsurface metagenome]
MEKVSYGQRRSYRKSGNYQNRPGERWQASVIDEKIKEGEEVEVLEVKGLQLIVKKYIRKE